MARSPNSVSTGLLGIAPSGLPSFERRAGWFCQLIASGTVRVYTDNVYISTFATAELSHYSNGMVGTPTVDVSGLVDGDIIYVKMTLFKAWHTESFAVFDGGAPTTYTCDVTIRYYTPDAITVVKNVAEPQTYPFWRLVTYRKSGSVEWLELHHEGDIHWTSPSILSQHGA